MRDIERMRPRSQQDEQPPLSLISRGAVTFNVEVALRRLGWSEHADLLLEQSMPTLLARIGRAERRCAGDSDTPPEATP
ncbi:hypothetical protein [Fodinicola acaciae]|uniref:hypothetical protein n=1 Tax=Fodinicola acaciae TaxID=2681555 RepID=UPI0013D8C572|nr:hypothetical protein [Fodinicola acaciae]